MPPHDSTKIDALPELAAQLHEAATIIGQPSSTPASSQDAAFTLDPCCLPRVPGFLLEAELGRGGMGVVFLARQVRLNRLVALKMILSGKLACEKTRLRFLAEAEAIARVQHPGIVQVYEFGMHDNSPYFALEYVSGGSLDKQLRGTPLHPMEAADLVEKLARAVECAHQLGIIHRDLKPANILLAEQSTTSSSTHPKLSDENQGCRRCPWQPKITDFGLVKQAGSEMTATGHIMGTPSYMAPEQADCKKSVSQTTDVYALGAILYECLTGRPPFKASTDLDTILQVVNDDPVSVRQLQPRTPKGLELICMKCLQKQPSKRYASAQLLAEDLGRFLAGEPVHAQPPQMLPRITEWFRRHPWALINVFGMIVAVLISLTYGFWTQTTEARWRQLLAEAKVERMEKNYDLAWKKLKAAEGLYEDPRLYDEAVKLCISKLSPDKTNVPVSNSSQPSMLQAGAGRDEREKEATNPRWKSVMNDPKQVAFSADKQLAAVAGNKQKALYLVDVETGKIVQTLTATPGHPRHWYEQVHHGEELMVGGDVIFSQNGERVAAQLVTKEGNFTRNAIIVWDVVTGQEYLRVPFSMNAEIDAKATGLGVIIGNQEFLLKNLHVELERGGALRWMHAVTENSSEGHMPVYIDIIANWLNKATGLPPWIVSLVMILLPWIAVILLRSRFARCRKESKLPSTSLILFSLLAGLLVVISGFLFLFSYFNTLGWSAEALLTSSSLYFWFFSNMLAGTQLLVLTANAYRVAEFGDEWKDMSLLGIMTRRA